MTVAATVDQMQKFVEAKPFQSGLYIDQNGKERFKATLNGKTVTYMSPNDVKAAFWASGKWLLAATAFTICAVASIAFAKPIALVAAGIAVGLVIVAGIRSDQNYHIWNSLSNIERIALTVMRNCEKCHVPEYKIIDRTDDSCIATVPMANLLPKNDEQRKDTLYLHLAMMTNKSYNDLSKMNLATYIDPYLKNVSNRENIIIKTDSFFVSDAKGFA